MSFRNRTKSEANTFYVFRQCTFIFFHPEIYTWNFSYFEKKSKSLSSIIQRNRHSLDADRKEDPKMNLTARKHSIDIIPLGPHQSGTTKNFSSTKKTKSVICTIASWLHNKTDFVLCIVKVHLRYPRMTYDLVTFFTIWGSLRHETSLLILYLERNSKKVWPSPVENIDFWLLSSIWGLN